MYFSSAQTSKLHGTNISILQRAPNQSSCFSSIFSSFFVFHFSYVSDPVSHKNVTLGKSSKSSIAGTITNFLTSSKISCTRERATDRSNGHLLVLVLFAMIIGICVVSVGLTTGKHGLRAASAAAVGSPYDDNPLYVAPQPTPHKVVTLGYLRMAGIDDESILAGYLATIRAENIKNNAPEDRGGGGSELAFTVKLDVITIECSSTPDCGSTLESLEKDYKTPYIRSLTNALNVTVRESLAASPSTSPYDADPTAFSLNATLMNENMFTNSEQALLAFFARMPFYSAVIRPNYLLAPRVIGHAKRLGIAVEGPDSYLSTTSLAQSTSKSGRYLPIISPVTIAEADYRAGSENILHFDHHIRSQLAHIFTFMQQAAGCAISGIIYENFSEMKNHVDYVTKMFTNGGLPLPAALSIDNVSTDDLLNFFFEDERRRCFVVLTSYNQFTNVVQRLVDNSNGLYIPTENRFFGTTLLNTPRFLLSNGDTDAFIAYYTRWSPQFRSTDPAYQIREADIFQTIYDHWSNGTSAQLLPTDTVLNADGRMVLVNDTVRWEAQNASAAFGSTVPIRTDGHGPASISGCDLCTFSKFYDAVPLVPDGMTFSAHIQMQIVLETIRSTIGRLGNRIILPSPAIPVLRNNTDLAAYSGMTNPYPFVASSDAVFTAHDGVTPVAATVVPHKGFIDSYFAEARTIGGYATYRLIRECSAKPLPQVCYCNTAPRTSYMFYVDSSINNNSMNGYAAVRYDDVSLGQKGIATVSFAATCNNTVTSWSYPLTGFLLLPQVPRETAVTDILTHTWGELVRAANYAANPPARPFRFAPFVNITNLVSQSGKPVDALQSYTDSYKPFVIFGSLQNSIPQTTTLTLFPAIEFTTEDPSLLPMEDFSRTGAAEGKSANSSQYWQPNLLHLQPVLADYIHAIASYYDGNEAKLFNGMPIRAIASTVREAELISLSFGSFGYLVPVSSIVVSTDPNLWASLLTSWLQESHPQGYATDADRGTGYNRSDFIFHLPFVIAASTTNTNGVIYRAFTAAKSVDKGILAVATGDVTVYNATVRNLNIATNKNDTNMPMHSSVPAPESAMADVIFGGMAPEWWVDYSRRYQSLPASLKSYQAHPCFTTALIAFEFMQSLAQYVQSDYISSAAAVLYTASPSIITRAGTFGPFSNASCPPEVIDGNAKDRQCQCTKGPRTMWVHSLKNAEQFRESFRTGHYTYSMVTCGVVYTPYIPPPPAARSLSSGAMAGIAVGCSLAVIGLIAAAIVANVFFLGRNNRAAPKDSTVPFAIVFTDIQSSTALWARAPAVMSQAVDDHHSIIRKAVRRNSGYEVKTVGDSFMVAFKQVDDAVDFALDVQLDLKSAPCWGTEIDAIYLELLAETEAEAEGSSDDINHDFRHQDKTVSNTNYDASDYRVGGVTNRGNSVLLFVRNANDSTLSASGHAAQSSSSRHQQQRQNSHLLLTSNLGPTSGGSKHPARAANDSDSEHEMTSLLANEPDAAVAVLGKSGTLGKNEASVTNTQNINRDAFGLAKMSHMQTSPHLAASTNENSNGETNKISIAAASTSLTALSGAQIGTENLNSFYNNNSSPVGPIPMPRKKEISFDATQKFPIMLSGQRGSVFGSSLSQPNNQSSNAHIESAHKTAATVSDMRVLVERHDGESHAAFSADYTAESAGSTQWWHGLRVRIGVHFGMGDIRKDPVTLGYDYYGTVVNTAARVEGVGHGGQILVTEDALSALSDGFVRNRHVVAIALGPQPLRGLDEPIKLHQLTPSTLAGRRFPALRLHVEKETEDTDLTDTSASTTTSDDLTAEELAARLCATRQFQGIGADSLILQYYFFLATFAPTTEKYKTGVVAKLGEAWGFDKASKSGSTRLLISMLGKIIRTFRASRKVKGVRNFTAGSTVYGESTMHAGTEIANQSVRGSISQRRLSLTASGPK